MSSTSTPTPRPLLNDRQAAEILGVSIRTLPNLVKRQGLRQVRLGRSVRYDPSDLEAFIQAQKAGNPQAK
jgi:excisionase family DNA binding protein